MVYLAQTGQHWWKDVESHWLCGIPQRCRWIAFVWLTMGIPNHPLHNTIYGGNVTYQRARWSLLDKCPGVDLGFMVNMFCNLAKMFWCIDLKSSLNGVKCLLLHHINWGHFPPRTLCMKESTMLGIPTSSHSGRCLRNWQRIKRKRSCVSMERFHCNRWTNNVGWE